MLDDKTHFIGVLVPDEITSTIEDGRMWMRRQYGCRSGHSTPVHVTLIPPFRAPEGTRNRDIMDAVGKALEKCSLPFEAKTDGFGTFSGRTIYGEVEDSRDWDRLRDEIGKELKKIGLDVKVGKGPLHPHLSVANRDIPDGAIGPALEYFKTWRFYHSFTVGEVCLFMRDGHRWVPAALLAKS